MSDYDGSIRINTQIDTKNASSQMMGLVNQIQKTADKVSSLRAKMDALRDVRIPTQEYQSLQKELDAATKELEKMVAQDSKLADIEVKIKKLSQSSAEYAKKMKEVAAQKIPTQEYENAQKQVDALEKKLFALYDRQDKFLSTGGKEDSSAYKRMVYDAEQLDIKLRQAETDIKSLVDSGKAFALGTDTEQYKNLSVKYESVNAELEKQKGIHSEIAQKQADSVQKTIELKGQMQQLVDTGRAFTLGRDSEEFARLGQELKYAENNLLALNRRHDELAAKQGTVSERFSNMQKSAKKAFNAVSQGTKKSNGLLSGFIGKIKTIALTVFVFNLIRKAFNTMIEMMKKGFKNFANYSSDFANSIQSMKNSMSTLGNQIAAAFAPIIQMIIPWLISFINVISKAMTYVAQFIAILGGKNTFTRAKQIQDSYNKSLGGTASAAKKAAGALAKFDDLDVLQKKEDDSGGGAEGTDPSQMFEEVPVDSEFKSWLDGILEKVKPILEYFEKLKDIFMEGFWDGLGDWEYRLESIKISLASIKESLIDIFTDPAVLEATDKWAQSVAYMLGSLVGSAASIGLTIATNLLGGIESYLEDNKDRIKDYLVSMFDVQAEVNYMLADFSQSFAYVFEAFASEGGIQLTANLIGIFLDTFMEITKLASEFARDVLNIFIHPFVENKEELRTALEGFLGVLAEVTGTIKQGIDDTFDKLNEVYDSHFKPFFDSIATGLSELLAKFLEFWNGNVQPILENWAQLFDELWTNHLQPFINNVIELFGGLADMLTAFWENHLKPAVEWFIEYILPPVMTVLDGIVDAAFKCLGFIIDIIDSMIESIKKVVKFLTDVFKGDWEAAWNDIVEMLSGSIYEKIKEAGAHFIEGIKEGIIEKWETLKAQVGEVAESIVGKFKDILGIHSPSTVMEEQGNYITEGLLNGIASKINIISELWNGLKENMVTTMQGIGEWFANFWVGIYDSVSVILQNIQSFFSETWLSISKTIIETWTGIQEWFNEFWLLFTETLYEIWDGILLFFTETWENITLVFQTFIDFINEVVIPIWQESWTTAQTIFQAFQTLIVEAINAIKTLLNDFFGKVVKTLIDVNWKNVWENAKKIFTGFKDKVSEVIGTVREIIRSFFDWAMDLINSILGAISDIGNAISGIFSGGSSNRSGGSAFSARSLAPAMASYSEQNFSAFMDKIPHLASGSVLRGGNPFMAILNDQPHGQTNIETPLPTMVNAFKQAISEMGGIGGGNISADMTLDGETVARLLVPYIIDEMGRQGLDVDILGVT